MTYRCEATSVTGFVQMLASNYLPHGYWFYATGRVPDRKSPVEIDEKLIKKYCVNVSRTSRSRRKRLGYASVHYLRHDRFFTLLATHGKQRFFDEESDIRDVRRSPIRYAGYSISCRRSGMRERLRDGNSEVKWHSHIQIDRPRFLEYKDHFVEIAARRTAEQLAAEFSRLPFEPYAPVRRQLLMILRAANQTRKTAGLEQLPYDVLRYRRNIVKPFEPVRKPDEFCDVDRSANFQAVG